ncbi:hypothetical protein ACFLZ8_06595 [Planctomycetota bacterium]
MIFNKIEKLGKYEYSFTFIVHHMYKYTQQVRDLINNPRKQFNLLKNPKLWNQLCSSLDVIEDTDLAIKAYQESKSSQNDGQKYLQLYGVLQALFLQQDAVDHLCESLSLERLLPYRRKFGTHLARAPFLRKIGLTYEAPTSYSTSSYIKSACSSIG